MNKSERLNDMMIYLNNKNYFHVSDLMEKYDISRSTALRDIRSLEAIGMPLFAEHGRYGRYGILKNRLLSPIVFTVDEMYALYFSMLTLRAYQSTPFDLDLQKLKQKFESCISQEQKSRLDKMGTVLSLASSKQVNDSPLLKEILYSSINNSVSDITYGRSGNADECTVQFLRISTSFGQWYATAYNYESEKLQVFRCDKILSLSINDDNEPLDNDKIESLRYEGFKDTSATDFEVRITDKGVDTFVKENYPSMQLAHGDEGPIIKGYYNKNEEGFIAHYLSSFGKEIISINPPELKKLIVDNMEEKLAHIKRL